jgi:DNA-binding transcriptional MerR regulator
MPVTTLRIWERRYGIVAPPTTASGQRVYSDGDVRRLARLKTLVDRGYAIGSIAKLDEGQLAHLESAGSTLAHPQSGNAPAVLNLTVIGDALTERLGDEAGELALLGLSVQTSYASLDVSDVERATAASVTAQVLLVEVLGLWDEVAERVLQIVRGARYQAAAVIYSFGSNGAAEALQLAGIRVYRRPGNRSELRQMLGDLRRECERQYAVLQPGERQRRRFDDRSLKMLSGGAESITCECPRHIVDLILQLDAFEAYSDNCADETPADQALHRLLGDLSNQARHAFESALEQVAAGRGNFARRINPD